MGVACIGTGAPAAATEPAATAAATLHCDCIPDKGMQHNALSSLSRRPDVVMAFNYFAN